MRVFPACNWTPAPVSNVVPMTSNNGRARCGRDKMNVSSKNARKCSPGAILLLPAANALCTPRLNNRDERVPLLTAFALPDVVADPLVVLPHDWWSPRKQILRMARGLGVQGFPEVWPASRSDTRNRKLPRHRSKSLSGQGWHQSTL